ncbi:MAG: hypothetical protein LBL49_06785 [Clostridiales Family XIII bacterium]|nr:hypothetical protein [Clostridiales Family XIII bacterium]
MKFTISLALLNIRRRIATSALAIAVCAATVVLLAVYFGNISAGQRQLTNLTESIPVVARVSNLIGTQVTGLQIKHERMQEIKRLENISEFRCTVNLMGEYTADAAGRADAHDINMLGVNGIDAFPALSAGAISMEDGVGLDFLDTNAAMCIASKEFLLKTGLAQGDTVRLVLYYYDYSRGSYLLRFLQLGASELKIAGSYTEADMSDSIATPAIICPYAWAEYIHEAVGVDFYADSAVFKVKELLIAYIVSYVILQGRQREFAIMRAVGTSAGMCTAEAFFESAVLALCGGLVGTVAALFIGKADPLSVLLAAVAAVLCYICGIIAPALARKRISVSMALSGAE